MSTIIKYGASGEPLLAHKSANSAVVMEFTTSKGGKKQTAHNPGKPSNDEEEGKTKWVPWGANNDFPRDIANLMRKSTVGRAGLHRLTKYIYGQRLITYKIESIQESGSEVLELIRDPEWLEITRRSNYNLSRLINYQDYAYYAIAFVEFIFTEDKTKVHSIYAHKASHCRFAPAKDGKIPSVFVSGNFPEPKAGEYEAIPVIDFLTYPSQIEEIKADKKHKKYIMPIFWPDVLNDYYPLTFWDSARESGWLDIAISIPAYKRSLFMNQMSIKYHIKVPKSYFTTRYTNWDTMVQGNKDKIIAELYDEVNIMLTGAGNAQKAIMSFMDENRQGESVGAWDIQVVDDKMKQGQWLPDASAANSEILFAMGMNPAISGQGNTGGSHSGGANNGGSNIRESGLDLRSQLKADRDILLTPFDFVKLYNGLDPDLEIGIQDMVLTTLDEGRGTKKVVS